MAKSYSNHNKDSKVDTEQFNKITKGGNDDKRLQHILTTQKNEKVIFQIIHTEY